MARDVIIDCDTGMDDAVALLLAIRSPELNVKGITCVNGNVNLDNVVKNTLRVVEHSGMDIPVYAGARTALIPNKVRDDASRVHRKDEFGNILFPGPTTAKEEKHAVDYIVETIMGAESPIDWITLGPLTNAALALLKEPRIIKNVRMLTMMAGGMNVSNVTPVAEFNIYADPEAARVVFESDIPITMIPLDPLCNGGYLTPDNINQIKAANQHPWCNMAAQIFDRTIKFDWALGRNRINGVGTISPPDLLAVAVAIKPEIAEIQKNYVTVETRGEFTRGMTVLDRRIYYRIQNKPNASKVRIVISVDQDKYAKLLLNAWL
ncbi:MAG: nucleoside hydrolase [Anaerolineaceae bacterium]|nr:nucleoside hydrolase [Anaerolineaceae bacterium]